MTRATHLSAVAVPMLFLQGSNDALADLDLLRDTLAGLGDLADLELISSADHAFHVPARTGRKDSEVLAAALASTAEWMARRATPQG